MLKLFILIILLILLIIPASAFAHYPIGSYYYYHLLNPHVPTEEELKIYALLPASAGTGISSYAAINFMDNYLKNQKVALTNLHSISKVYPDVSKIIFRP